MKHKYKPEHARKRYGPRPKTVALYQARQRKTQREHNGQQTCPVPHIAGNVPSPQSNVQTDNASQIYGDIRNFDERKKNGEGGHTDAGNKEKYDTNLGLSIKAIK
jgi:hypothetical protein